ncbi:MAG: DUF6106 family protein [Lachnospiraceae bacterium]|nr:DUF6106 family protein [Lachnospiraceae bacterium]
MNDMYKELLIEKPESTGSKALRFGLIAAAVAAAAAGFLLLNSLFFLLATLLGAGAWWAFSNAACEYEYLYVNGDIDIDRIINRQKRKKAASYDIADLEMLAPAASHDLDSFKNDKGVRQVDYTSDPKGARVYGAVYAQEKGRVLAWLELDEEIIRDMRRHQPRKISRDCL